MHQIAEFVATYTQLADTILASGPDIQDDLNDLVVIRDACLRIKDRTIKRFGLAAVAGLTDEQLAEAAEHADIKAANEKLAAVLPHGVKGPFLDMLMQLVNLVATNPALLQLILSLLKKPA
jgi:hypothetical protein